MSPAQCAMLAASSGIEWSFGKKRGLGIRVSPMSLPACRHGAGLAPSLKARAVRAPGSADLSALTGRRRPGWGSPCANRRGVPTPIGEPKLLIYQAMEGTILDAYSEIAHHQPLGI